MPGELTQYGANRAVKVGVGQAVAAASAMYLALATAEAATPDVATLADFAANEISTAGYQRQAVTWSAPSADPSLLANDAEIEFGPFTADPPEVTHVFLCDTSVGTAGNVLAYWTLDLPRDMIEDDSLVFGPGDLDMSVD